MSIQMSNHLDDIEMQDLAYADSGTHSYVQQNSVGMDVPTSQLDAGTTDTDFHNDSTEHTLSDNLLQLHRKGIIGLMERTPLPIKLIVMCLVSIVGMTLFVILTLTNAGTSTHRSIVHKETNTFVYHMSKYIMALQDERTYSTVYLSTNVTDANLGNVTLLLRAAMGNTQKKQSEMYTEQSQLREYLGNKYEQLHLYFDDLKYLEGLTDQNRKQVQSRTISSSDSFRYYQKAIHSALLLQTKVIEVADLGYKGTTYLFVARLIEATEKMKPGAMNLLFGASIGVQRFTAWLSFKKEFEIYQMLFLTTQNKRTLEEFFLDQGSLTNPLRNYNLTEVNMLIEYAVTNNNGSLSFNPADAKLYGNVLARLVAELRIIEGSIVDSMFESALSQGRNSIVQIVVFCIIAFLFAVLSIVTAVVLSSTIISPWRRMNRIQELAIAKFVPKGFLHMIGCKRITDIKLGMHIKKDKLTLMEVEVLDFAAVSQLMNDEELFSLLNQYLTFVGPLIRKYDGFIQSYQGERFTALFKSAEKAVKASLEMQETINMFNEDQPYVDIRLGTRIHSDSALIGTLGENERIDGAILSPSHSHIKTALTRLTNKLQARTLTTKNVISACYKNAKRYQVRRIGSVASFKASSNDKYQDSMEVYELLHPEDTGKLAQKETFNTALDLFLHGRYGDSVKEFEKVCQESSERDGVAEAYLQKALDLQKQTKLVVQSLQMGDILQDEVLRESFEQFCIAERSQENISIWNKIQEYRTIIDRQERMRFAKELYDKYFSLNGLYTVNINESMKMEVLDKIQKNDTVTIDHTLFERVKQELELLMSTDTLSRYKSSERFQMDINKSSVGVRAPLLDEM